MLRTIVAAVSIATGVLLATNSAQASSTVIFQEAFEEYIDQAAIESAWSRDGDPQMQLDAGFGNTGQSIKMLGTNTGNGTTNRWTLNLDRTYVPSEARPLVFSYDLYLDPAGAPWNLANHTCDIRGYSGGGYKLGEVQAVLAIGVGSYWVHEQDHYQARVYSLADGNSQYYLDQQPTAPFRSPGWHHLEARITSHQIAFSIDGLLAEVTNRSLTAGFNSVAIGSGSGANGHTMWADNLRLEIMPEPATLALLALGAGIGLRPRGRGARLAS